MVTSNLILWLLRMQSYGYFECNHNFLIITIPDSYVFMQNNPSWKHMECTLISRCCKHKIEIYSK